jgi:16S rRNA (uracil1498-N3)-methyltransferase
MSDRFFSSDSIAGPQVVLRGPEAHHLLHVMRAQVGQRVVLFDGRGSEFEAEITACHRSEVELHVIGRRESDRELPFELVVGVSLPKGDRQKWLVEKLTELGVTTLVPLATERGIAQPTAGALDRLRRGVVEAAKQCGRNRLMQVAVGQEWNDWAVAGSYSSGISATHHRRLLAHPGGKHLSELELGAPLPTCVAIGPEGGFTVSEVHAALAAGWQPVDLGRRILRVETAAVALVAAVTLAVRA